MTVYSWAETFIGSLRGMWVGFLDGLIVVIGALVVLIIGLIVAGGIGKLIEKVVKLSKLDKAITGLKIKDHFERGGLEDWTLSRFIGRFTYWFLVIVALLATSDILGFTSFSDFLRDALGYLPNVIIAVLIMLAALLLGNFLRKLVRASIKSARLNGEEFLGSLTWWAVVIFGFLAALSQLGVAVAIIQSLVTGFIAMIALAGGIAFGLGGKDLASHLLNKLRGEE